MIETLEMVMWYGLHSLAALSFIGLVWLGYLIWKYY